MRVFVSSSLVLVVASLASVLASPASKYVLHERVADPGKAPQLIKRTKLNSNDVLPIRIGLTQANLDQGHDWLMNIAHPESPEYGKHWEAAEIHKAFLPSPETFQVVKDWLVSAGVENSRISISDNGGWFAFDASVEEAEQLFRAQYYETANTANDKYTIGCDQYYLPEHIQRHIDYVTPGVKHHEYKRSTSSLSSPVGSVRSRVVLGPPISTVIGNIDIKSASPNCTYDYVTADCIRSLYNMPAVDLQRKVDPSNTFALFEALRQSYSQADLNLWFRGFANYIPAGTRPVYTSIDGGIGPVSQADVGIEAQLDLTIAYGLTYPQTINMYSVDDYIETYYTEGFFDTFLDALDGSFCTYSAYGQTGNNNTLDPIYPDPASGGYKGPLQCGTVTPPKVLSVSYGGTEGDLPVNYLRRQCNEWMKLSLMGTTIVSASGDSGVSADASVSDNGCLLDGTVFAPAFSSGCPYILSVGATQIRPNVSGFANDPERAVLDTTPGYVPFTSGGGFSNIFARPSYQDNAVNTWFKNFNPGYPYYSTSLGKNIGKNGGVDNRAGRGYPDISANGAYYPLYLNGTLGLVGGTSMSAPIVASMISLLNQARSNHGKSSLGWVNPTLYANPQAFTDITDGYNQGCDKDVAFEAVAGWDPVTGLGTPNFAKLKDIFLSLP